MALAANVSVDVVDRPRPQIRKGQGGTLSLKLYLDGTQNKPSLATINVKRPGGAACTTPVANASVTIDGTTGTMTYALTAGNADLLPGYGDAYAPWTAEWTVTDSNGTVRTFLTTFDVVLFPIYNVVTQADLVNHHKDLTDSLFTGESDAQLYIDMAQEDIYRRLENAGNRAWLIIDSETLRRPTEHLALAKYFASRITGEINDRWKDLRDYHQKEADSWFDGTRFTYDFNQTGSVTPEEVGRASMQPAFRI